MGVPKLVGSHLNIKTEKPPPVRLIRPQWNSFAGCSFLITFFVEFEIYYKRGKLIKSPSVTSKMQVRYL